MLKVFREGDEGEEDREAVGEFVGLVREMFGEGTEGKGEEMEVG